MKNIFSNGSGQEDREYNKYLKIEIDTQLINVYANLFEMIVINISELRFSKN